MKDKNIIGKIADKLHSLGVTGDTFPDVLEEAVLHRSGELFSLPAEDYGKIYSELRFAERTVARTEIGSLAPKSVARATGVYTPRWVADTMAARAVSEALKDFEIGEIDVIDPAVGCGQLLLSAYRELRRLYIEEGTPLSDIPFIAAARMYGCDLDECAVRIARLSLCRAALSDNASVTPELFKNVLALDVSGAVGSLQMPKEEKTPGDALLRRKYAIVLVNPPYLGKKYIPKALSEWLKEHIPLGKNELYAAFLIRSLSFLKEKGILSFLSIHSWMFLSSFAALREKLLREESLLHVLHLGAGTFTELSAFNALSAVLTLRHCRPTDASAITFSSLTAYTGRKEKEECFAEAEEKSILQNCFFRYNGAPLLYMLPPKAYDVLAVSQRLGDRYPLRQGLATGDNDRFVRFWYEPNPSDVVYGCTSAEDAVRTGKRWFPYNKGGFYRKWYGMNEYVVDYFDNGKEILSCRDENGKLRSRPQNRAFYFKEGITWSLFGFENFGVRYKPSGFIFDVSGSSLFASEDDLYCILAFLCSNVAFYYLSATAPTVNFQVGNIADLPFIMPSPQLKNEITALAKENIGLCKEDWDEKEISFDFRESPLLRYGGTTLEAAYQAYAEKAKEKADSLRRNEERINRLFINLYGLEKILTPYVKERDLTLKVPTEGESVRELFSYFVMKSVGRYGERREPLYPHGSGYVKVSMLKDGFLKFLNQYFSFRKNLPFVENALGMKLDTYIEVHFMKDHIRKYQKHPILMRLTEKGNDVLIPIHGISDTLIDSLPFTKEYKHKLVDFFRDFRPDDGWKINGEKLKSIGII